MPVRHRGRGRGWVAIDPEIVEENSRDEALRKALDETPTETKRVMIAGGQVVELAIIRTKTPERGHLEDRTQPSPYL